MKFIKVIIERFTDPSQPGFVECSFTDAWSKKHQFEDKGPIFSTRDLDANSSYPQEGVIACEVLREWTDKEGRNIISVTTEKPWYVDSKEGLFEFDLQEGQFVDVMP